MRRALGAQVHALRRIAVHVQAERVRALRVHPREVHAAVQEREVGRDDHVVGHHHLPLLGLDARRLAVLDVCGLRVLEDVAALTGDLLRDRDEELARVELGLVLDPDRPRHLPRKVGHGREARLEPGAQRGLDLVLDLLAPLLVLRVGERRLAPPVAVDPELLDERGDLRDGRLVGLPVRPGALLAEARRDRLVLDPVQRADLGGGVGGHALGHAAGLEHRHPRPVALQEERRHQTGHPPAENGHVDVDLAVERRVGGLAAGGDPVRGVGGLGHQIGSLPGWAISTRE